MGPSTLAGLVGAAVWAALATASGPTAAADNHEPEPAPLVEPASKALASLLHHERASGGGRLRRALEAHANGDGPAKIRAAALRLLASADLAGDPRLVAVDQVWEAAGDHRDRGILVHRALRLDRRTSTIELAQALGVSENRVRQIESRTAQRARDAADGVATLAANLGDRLGPVCRLAAVDDALADWQLPARDEPRSALLVWLAGPYVPIKGHEGWAATDPTTLLAEARRPLYEDGGVRQLDHVAADLEAAGIAAHDVGDWLAAQEVVVFDGLVVTLSGSAADVAERLLSATGRAMTATDLAAAGAAPDSAATGPSGPSERAAPVLDGRLRRDPRFVRVDRDHFELAEWGGAAFTETPPSAPAELFPGSGREASTGRSQLRVEVDDAVLRGASDAVPLAVVEALGVACGGRRTFTTRYGPVALSRTAARPSRGSVRPVALAAGASAGDALVLDFDAATGDASVELVLASRSAAG